MTSATEYDLPCPENFPRTFRQLFPNGAPKYRHQYERRVHQNMALYRGTWICPTEKDMEWAAENPDSPIPTAAARRKLDGSL